MQNINGVTSLSLSRHSSMWCRLVSSIRKRGPDWLLLLLLMVIIKVLINYERDWCDLFFFLRIFSILLIFLYIIYIRYIHNLYNISNLTYNLYNTLIVLRKVKVTQYTNCEQFVNTLYHSVFPLYTLVKYKLQGPHSPANNLKYIDFASVTRPYEDINSVQINLKGVD